MSARLLLVRHGRTTANAAGLLMGRTDAPLLPEARAAATALGRHLDLPEQVVVHTSDQPRARLTAHLLCHPRKLRPIPDAALRERDFGRYTLTAFADLAHDPDWPAVDTHYDVRPDGGESLADVEQRLFTRLLHLHDTLPPQATLLAVGHSTTWRLVEAVLQHRRHDHFDEPIPPPLTVLDHPREVLEVLREHL